VRISLPRGLRRRGNRLTGRDNPQGAPPRFAVATARRQAKECRHRAIGFRAQSERSRPATIKSVGYLDL
jgi:hypothetical protein